MCDVITSIIPVTAMITDVNTILKQEYLLNSSPATIFTRSNNAVTKIIVFFMFVNCLLGMVAEWLK